MPCDPIGHIVAGFTLPVESPARVGGPTLKLEWIVRLGTGVLAAVVLVLGSSPAISHQPRDPRRIEIAVTDNGFEPSQIPVLQHEEVTLVFTRKTDRVCAKGVTLQYDRRDAKRRIEISLELNKPSVLTTRFSIRGTHIFSCSHETKSGAFLVD